jgi:hypothetical protein
MRYHVACRCILTCFVNCRAKERLDPFRLQVRHSKDRFDHIKPPLQTPSGVKDFSSYHGIHFGKKLEVSTKETFYPSPSRCGSTELQKKRFCANLGGTTGHLRFCHAERPQQGRRPGCAAKGRIATEAVESPSPNARPTESRSREREGATI